MINLLRNFNVVIGHNVLLRKSRKNTQQEMRSACLKFSVSFRPRLSIKVVPLDLPKFLWHIFDIHNAKKILWSPGICHMSLQMHYFSLFRLSFICAVKIESSKTICFSSHVVEIGSKGDVRISFGRLRTVMVLISSVNCPSTCSIFFSTKPCALC